MPEKMMTFWEHVAELRKRLKVSAIVFVVTFLIYFYGSDVILKFLLSNFANEYKILLISPSVMSGFITELNISMILAVATSLPILIYEIFMFIDPALDKKTERLLMKIFFSSFFLFIAGVVFVYYIMIPLMLEFFVQVNTQLGVNNYFLVEDFFDFIVINLFLGGLTFQTPLIIILLNRIGIFSKATLSGARRYIYVITILIAGIVTPDHSIISQLALGGMMMLLFEIALLFCK